MLEHPKAPGADYAKISEIQVGNQQGTLAVTDFEIGWLAGVIDGEGTVAFSVYSLRHRGKIIQVVRVKPQVIVTNTDKELVERAADIFKRSGVGAHFATREQHGRSFAVTKTYRPLHVANVSGFKRAKKALELIVPHLVSKKAKAELVLRYIRQRELKMSVQWPGRNRPCPVDAEDLRLIREILLYSAANSIKGSKSKHIGWIEGLLNEHEQRGSLIAA
jgi:hypothetical protein